MTLVNLETNFIFLLQTKLQNKIGQPISELYKVNNFCKSRLLKQSLVRIMPTRNYAQYFLLLIGTKLCENIGKLTFCISSSCSNLLQLRIVNESAFIMVFAHFSFSFPRGKHDIKVQYLYDNSYPRYRMPSFLKCPEI